MAAAATTCVHPGLRHLTPNVSAGEGVQSWEELFVAHTCPDEEEVFREDRHYSQGMVITADGTSYLLQARSHYSQSHGRVSGLDFYMQQRAVTSEGQDGAWAGSMPNLHIKVFMPDVPCPCNIVQSYAYLDSIEFVPQGLPLPLGPADDGGPMDPLAIPGKAAKALLQAAMGAVRRLCPWVTHLSFNDHSFIMLRGTHVLLLPLQVLQHGKTWFEIELGAVAMPGFDDAWEKCLATFHEPTNHDAHSWWWYQKRNFCVPEHLPPPTRAQTEGVDPPLRTVDELYAQAGSYHDFFQALRQHFSQASRPEDVTADYYLFLQPWVQPFVRRFNATAGGWWVIKLTDDPALHVEPAPPSLPWQERASQHYVYDDGYAGMPMATLIHPAWSITPYGATSLFLRRRRPEDERTASWDDEVDL